jgi:hypothetical protein
VSIEAAAGAASTKDASIPVSIAFSDDVAGPYPANYMCVAAGTDPCATNDYSQRRRLGRDRHHEGQRPQACGR